MKRCVSIGLAASCALFTIVATGCGASSGGRSGSSASGAKSAPPAASSSLVAPQATLPTIAVPASEVLGDFISQLGAVAKGQAAGDIAEWQSKLAPGDTCTLIVILNTPGLISEYLSAGDTAVVTNRAGTVGVKAGGDAGFDDSDCLVPAQQVVNSITG
jgi:hypothetical protein